MKALFFGLGGIGQRHLRILKKLYPNARVAAVRTKGRLFEIGDDLRPDYSIDIVSKYDICVYPSLKEALEFRPDFSIVANPTSMHVSTAKELLKNNIPVFLEKPISDNLQGTIELLRLARRTKVPVMAGYMMRFHPCALKLRHLIENRRIGRIYSVNVNINSYMPGWHSYEKYNAFYAGIKSLGGGVVLTEIHELDLLAWYFGLPEKLWVVGGKMSALKMNVEDTATILMKQKFDGVRFPICITMSFVHPFPGRKMVITGEKGAIEWDITASEIITKDHTKKKQEQFKVPGFQRNTLFADQLRHFIDCLKKKKNPTTSLFNVVNGQLLVLAIKEALENDKIMSVYGLNIKSPT